MAGEFGEKKWIFPSRYLVNEIREVESADGHNGASNVYMEWVVF